MTHGKQSGKVKSKRCAVCGLYRSGSMSMHKMPSDNLRKKLWSKAIGKELYTYSLICSNHFKESDFIPNMGNRLKPDAIPLQFNSGSSIAQSQTRSQSLKSLISDLACKQIDDTSSENHSSDQNSVVVNSQKEQCFIYYLDEEQNVGVFESSVSESVISAFVESIDSNSNKSNETISLHGIEINQENSSFNVDINMTQSISDTYTEAEK